MHDWSSPKFSSCTFEGAESAGSLPVKCITISEPSQGEPLAEAAFTSPHERKSFVFFVNSGTRTHTIERPDGSHLSISCASSSPFESFTRRSEPSAKTKPSYVKSLFPSRSITGTVMSEAPAFCRKENEYSHSPAESARDASDASAQTLRRIPFPILWLMFPPFLRFGFACGRLSGCNREDIAEDGRIP